METYTTTAGTRTLELEIVQAAPYGYAVNFHQMDECVGKLYFDGKGYRVTAGELEINMTDGEKKLGTFSDKWDALAAIVANLDAYLASHEDADATHDPADAEELLLDLLDPETYGDHLPPAARRDILRRAAYDMGINDRRAHTDMLPTIARRAADMIQQEMAPIILRNMKADLAEILADYGWTTARDRTDYKHEGRDQNFQMAISAESITLYMGRPRCAVEMLTLDRKHTSAERLARIILAIFE